MNRTGAEMVWTRLLDHGAEVVFGYPGGAILPTYDALTRFPKIRHVLTRHEQGAAHMADGFARATGRVGVAMATSGPGATNLVTGIATAHMDSSPLVCITGQVPSTMMGSDAFQETDIVGITVPITKHGMLVTKAKEIAPAIDRAFAIAADGRPGPVVVDITKDAQLESAPTNTSSTAPDTRRRQPPSEDAIAHAVRLLAHAERPVILAGHGVLIARAWAPLRSLAESADIPVALTLLGKGAFPEGHPLCLGMMGMHGTATANHAIQNADLLLALGMRFDDRVTGTLETYAPMARKIHIDIDPTEIGKNVAVDVGIAADLGEALTLLAPRVRPTRHEPWLTRIAAWRQESAARDIATLPRTGRFHAAHAIGALHRHTDGNATIVSDVGQHQMWEAQYYPHQRPGTLITSGGLGTMGFAVPAAIGAQIARPNEEVWAVVGDGGFQMTMAELATAVQEQLPLKIAIINNGFLGMVRQWQELFHERRYNATPMSAPDFCHVARAFGIPAQRVTQAEDVPTAIAAARAHRDGPYLLDLVVEQHDIVYPMVPAGAGLDEMIRRPGREPPIPTNPERKA